MSDLLQKAISELNRLPTHQQDVIAAWILERIEAEEAESEAEWESRVLKKKLGDALLPDGSFDPDKLMARGRVISLEELYPEGDEDDES